MEYVFDSRGYKRYAFPTHSNDIVIDRKDACHAEVFMVEIEPGKATHVHEHDDLEQIFHILEGNGVLKINNNQEYSLKAGLVARIPPKTVHSVKALGQGPLRYLCIDCFSRSRKEETWEAHVHTICKEQGYSFDSVVKSGK